MFDLMKLRPAGATAAAIKVSLDVANAAERDHAAEVARLLRQRDGLLLDGTAAAIKAADVALIAAREHGEKLTAVRAQLAERLDTALESEQVAAVHAAKLEAEAAAQALSRWWVAQRKKLAAELGEGMRLQAAAASLQDAHDQQLRRAAERYPTRVFENRHNPSIEASGWHHDLASAASGSTSAKVPFQDLLTSCDPRPLGQF